MAMLTFLKISKVIDVLWKGLKALFLLTTPVALTYGVWHVEWSWGKIALLFIFACVCWNALADMIVDHLKGKKRLN
ncbi:MAG: hypothetical protein RLZZ360_658 [Candidatus Parcubacteria bacterium]|jgi:hypothetical protein